MKLRDHKDLMVIALIQDEHWEQIRSYCMKRDVTTGGDYDCPYDGCINVWLQENWVNPLCSLPGSYYTEASQTNPDKTNVYWHPNTHSAVGQQWSVYLAREHFMVLFLAAIGREYLLR